MKSHLPDETQPDQPNMTPFIDIVFQLLIFFMLTLQFKQVEGRIVSQLPRGGPLYAPPLDDVRVTLCVGGDLRAHAADKRRHDALRRAGAVTLAVEGEIIAVLPGVDAPRDPFQLAARRTAEIRAEGRTVIIDADSEVPYDHVMALLNELKRVRIENVEFAANPRLSAIR